MNSHCDKSTFKHFLDNLRGLPAFDTIWTHRDSERKQVVGRTNKQTTTEWAHKALWVSTPVKIFIEEAGSGGRETSIPQKANLYHVKNHAEELLLNTANKLSSSKYPFSRSSDLKKKKIPWGREDTLSFPQNELQDVNFCQCVALGERSKSGHLVWKLVWNCIRSMSLRPKSEKSMAGLAETVQIFLQRVWIDKKRWEYLTDSWGIPLPAHCSVLFLCFTNLRLLLDPTVNYWDPTKNVNCLTSVVTFRINRTRVEIILKCILCIHY